MYTIRPPYLIKKFYYELIWRKKQSNQPIIYLTFDDGPVPEATPFVLETLRQFQIKATFFCIGENIQKHPDIFERLKKENHCIGNHTFSHLKGWETPDKIYLQNIAQCQLLTQSTLFRPPYGRIKKTQIKALKAQFDIVMWSVLSGDFDTNLSPEKCLKNVINHTKNGDIVVFHDSMKAFDRLKYTLPKALAYWLGKGYSFKTL